MDINIPRLSLVLLVGPRDSGKAAFARANFDPANVVSSDDVPGASARSAANESAGLLVENRLAQGHGTVVAAANLTREHRQVFLQAAYAQHVPCFAIVFFPRVEAATGQVRGLEQEIKSIEKEKFSEVFILRDEVIKQSARITHDTLSDRAFSHDGPLDIIGDIHGCFAELTALLTKLGYRLEHGKQGALLRHDEDRKVVFLGDLVDRGPDSPSVLSLVMNSVAAGHAWCVPGNHDLKLVRKLKGADVAVSRGLAETLQQLTDQPQSFKDRIVAFFTALPSHYCFDGGRLVTAHAGLPERFHGRDSREIRAFALYGKTTGERDQYGLPVRLDWAADYEGKAVVVYGHTALAVPQWVNNTICIDTGCVYGGRLTALRYPERDLISVAAQEVWYPSAKPLFTPIDEPDGATP